MEMFDAKQNSESACVYSFGFALSIWLLRIQKCTEHQVQFDGEGLLDLKEDNIF
jgi:hypothetical protein